MPEDDALPSLVDAGWRTLGFGDDDDLATVLLNELESGFDGVLIKRVDDAGYALPDEGVGLRVDADLGGVRHLLDRNDDVHSHCPGRVHGGSARRGPLVVSVVAVFPPSRPPLPLGEVALRAPSFGASKGE